MFTDPLRGSDREDTHWNVETQTDGHIDVPLLRHEPQRVRSVKQFFTVACAFVSAGTSLPSHFLATIEKIHIQAHRQQGDISVLLFFFFKIRKIS